MGLDEDFAAAAEDISNNVNKTLSDDELKEVKLLIKVKLGSNMFYKEWFTRCMRCISRAPLVM